LKILITGAAGFIGYHLTKSFLEEGSLILGIDNINKYYDQSLKKSRLKKLKNFKNFLFEQIDISDREALEGSFKKFNPDIVVNLAAQAGVRYSIINPYEYASSNIIGFLNIIELCRHNNVKGFIYASSSSVYGGNEQIPFSVEDRVDNPISFYAATKKSNELIANSYSNLYGLHTTGLRYFTVYGPWGRPDMAYYIFTKKIFNGEPISVFNNGDMKRDFTYIDDIILGTKSAINKNYKCEIFNLGNNKSEQLMDMINIIEKEIGVNAKIDYQDMQPGDVKETYADINKSKEMLNYSPRISIYEGIPKFVKWYKNHFISKMN
jgi:UDP-glucuronate 4-epimerase